MAGSKLSLCTVSHLQGLIALALDIRANSPSTSLKDFKATAATKHFSHLLKQDRQEVELLAEALPMPGNYASVGQRSFQSFHA